MMSCEVPIPVYKGWYILAPIIYIKIMIGVNKIYQSYHSIKKKKKINHIMFIKKKKKKYQSYHNFFFFFDETIS